MMGSKSGGIRNVAELRSQARDELNDGAITLDCGGDVVKTVELLNDALATEIVCVLRYKNLVEMITEGLVAERIAVLAYRDMVRYFADRDPTPRRMIEGILAQESSPRKKSTRADPKLQPRWSASDAPERIRTRATFETQHLPRERTNG
jgi:ferritin-like protein